MKYSCQNRSKLLPSHTVNEEVDGAVEDRQVASKHVHQELPFRPNIPTSWCVEASNHQVVSKTTNVCAGKKCKQNKISTWIFQTPQGVTWAS